MTSKKQTESFLIEYRKSTKIFSFFITPKFITRMKVVTNPYTFEEQNMLCFPWLRFMVCFDLKQSKHINIGFEWLPFTI